MRELKTIVVNIDELLFDPNNHRLRNYWEPVFPESEFNDPQLQEQVYEMLKTYAIDIKKQILYNGFLQHEIISVKKVGNKYVVSEGNRRICAIKWILKDPDASKERRAELKALSEKFQVMEIVESEPLYELLLKGNRRGNISKHDSFENALVSLQFQL